MSKLNFPASKIANKDDIKNAIDENYNPKSQNAQSGKAVAEAVSGSMPIPEYQETYDIEKVAVYDDSYYLEMDENGNYVDRYIPPSAIRPRPIDDGKGYSNITGLVGSKSDTANRAGYIAARDNKGNLWTGTPVDDQDCVPYSMYKELLERIKTLEQKV